MIFADFVALWFLAEEKWYLRKTFNMFDALRNVVIVLFYESKKTLEIFSQSWIYSAQLWMLFRAIVDAFGAIVDVLLR